MKFVLGWDSLSANFVFNALRSDFFTDHICVCLSYAMSVAGR